MTRLLLLGAMPLLLAACEPPPGGSYSPYRSSYETEGQRLQKVGEQEVANVDTTGFDALE
ncbi:hypothetical protein LCM08_17775 [Salipiger pacificus]|nr:hypothetical protein [Alloyangia pacifica]